MIGPSFHKRDAVIALAIGPLTAFGLNIWFNAVAKPETIDGYLWLARLQEPGAPVGERLARFLYPTVGYPWNVSVAVPCAYGVLIVLWMVVVFALIGLGRLMASAYKAVSPKRAAH